MSDGVNRRKFLKYMSFTGAFAVFEKSKAYEARRLIPYLIPPDDITPGLSTWYATVCRECPAGCGMHVRCREGRAVKAEGNPEHPVNQGALCARGQAALQGLYNPQRVTKPLFRDSKGKLQPISWEEAERKIVHKINILGGQEAAVITPLITGSLLKLVTDWLDTVDNGKHYTCEPFAYETARTANETVFGHEEIPHYSFEKAKMLISLGAEFLDSWGSPVEYSRNFAEMHSYRLEGVRQFVSIEPRLSLAAANADEWLRVNPGSEAAVIMAMVHTILKEGWNAPLPQDELSLVKKLSDHFDPQKAESASGLPADTIIKVAKMFVLAKPGLALGTSLTSGGKAGVDADIAVNLLNYICGNVGKTVTFGKGSSLDGLDKYEKLVELTESMHDGKIGLLFMNNVNPAANLPSGLRLEEAMEKVSLKVALSSFLDGATASADLVLPATTPLEEWGDYSPRSGIVGLMQPVMRTIYPSRSLGDTILSLSRGMGEADAKKFPWDNFHLYLQEYWKGLMKEYGGGGDFRTFWESSLRRGGVWKKVDGEEVSLSPKLLTYKLDAPSGDHSVVEDHGDTGEKKKAPHSHKLIHFPGTLYGDKGANRSWLQELPDPLHKITWGSWVEISPESARELMIREGDVLILETGKGRIEAPALLYKGMSQGVIALPVGQGQTASDNRSGRFEVDPFLLMHSEPDPFTGGPQWTAGEVKITRTKKSHKLATTRGHRHQRGREIIQFVVGGALKLIHDPKHKGLHLKNRTGFLKHHEHPEHRWGMVIDLQKCTGCSACVAGCYAENNIGIVGREQIIKGREMAWLSIQNYEGENGEGGHGAGDHRLHFIPMLCQHCDYAPCEPVCPVYAAYHTSEGLNAQIYNRCVGTRYCANNCPYKMRRFNWFEWKWPEPLNWQLNPDVTVRSMGVMEKCTFCVQRIIEGKNRAKDEGREVRDGEITPACAQTCPAGAITFGDLKDENSLVSRLAKDKRGYRVLEEVNTDPAITYLKKVL